MEIVNNIKVMPESLVTITFGGTGVMGQGSCNSYTGTYRTTAGGIKFESILTTMRACDDARMSQERDFLGLLREVTSYELQQVLHFYSRPAPGKRSPRAAGRSKEELTNSRTLLKSSPGQTPAG